MKKSEQEKLDNLAAQLSDVRIPSYVYDGGPENGKPIRAVECLDPSMTEQEKKDFFNRLAAIALRVRYKPGNRNG